MSDGPHPSRRSVIGTLGAVVGIGVAGTGSALARHWRGPPTEVPPSRPKCGSPPQSDRSPIWSQFQGDAAKTGVAPTGPASNPRAAARFQVEDDGDTWPRSRLYGSPVVDDAIYAPMTDGLVAVAPDGELRWSLTIDLAQAFPYSTPAVADGVVYVGVDLLGDDFDEEPVLPNGILAVDAADGTERWRAVTDGDSMTTPTVAEGSVFAVSPGRSSHEGRLYAFDAATGERRWTHALGTTGIRGHTTGPVAVADGVVYVPGRDLLALDAESGDVLWRSEAVSNLKGTLANAPAIVDDTVYVGTGGAGGEFYAVSADDGTLEWSFQVSRSDGSAGSGAFTSAAVHEGGVYVGYLGIDDTPTGYYALEAGDVSARWFREAPDVVSPAVADTTVYAGATALAVADGATQWSMDVPDATSPALAGGRLYVGGDALTTIEGRPD